MEEEEGERRDGEQREHAEGGANTELVGFVPIQKLGGFARRFGKQSGLGGWMGVINLEEEIQQI